MPEPTAENSQQLQQPEIDAKCKDLFRECTSLLIGYGEKGEVKDKVWQHINNAFAPTPTKIPVNPLLLKREVFYNGQKTNVRILDVDWKSKANKQIQIEVGDKPDEFLVMEEEKAWIHVNQPPRDINEPGIPPPSNRKVTQEDILKYQAVVDFARGRAPWYKVIKPKS